MNEQQFREALAADGFGEPVVVEWEPGSVNDSHSHDFTAHGMVLAGGFRIESEAGAQECGPGDTFRLQAGVAHSERVGPDGCRLLVGRKS